MDHAREIPDAFAILPSGAYVFGQAECDYRSYQITARRRLIDGVEVLAINQGLLAFDFKQSDLAGRHLQKEGSGDDDEARESFIALQSLRLRFAIFVSACIYGTHAKRTHTALDRPRYPGLSDIYSWVETPNSAVALPSFERDRLLFLFDRRNAIFAGRQIRKQAISIDSFLEGVALADRLMAAAPGYEVADPIAMVAMTYQAAVLHGRQHAGASIALAAVIAEAVVEELLFAVGLVAGVETRLKRLVSDCREASQKFSKSQLKSLGFNGMVGALEGAGLVNGYLVQRISSLRQARNALMHDAQDAVPRQSGDALTVLRDLLWLCTGETSFELITAWSYRC